MLNSSKLWMWGWANYDSKSKYTKKKKKNKIRHHLNQVIKVNITNFALISVKTKIFFWNHVF